VKDVSIYLEAISSKARPNERILVLAIKEPFMKPTDVSSQVSEGPLVQPPSHAHQTFKKKKEAISQIYVLPVPKLPIGRAHIPVPTQSLHRVPVPYQILRVEKEKVL